MQLIKFLFVMIGLSPYFDCGAQIQNKHVLSYLEFAREQKIELSSAEGIIIFDDSQQTIPQYVIFIPAIINKENTIEGLLEKKLSDPSTLGYIVYFQGIRWILPDLGEIVKSLNFTIIKYTGLDKEYKISYGKFTFDKKHKGDPDLKYDDTITKGSVQINNKTLSLSVIELPEAMGLPKLFEKVDVKL